MEISAEQSAVVHGRCEARQRIASKPDIIVDHGMVFERTSVGAIDRCKFEDSLRNSQDTGRIMKNSGTIIPYMVTSRNAILLAHFPRIHRYLPEFADPQCPEAKPRIKGVD